MSRLSAGLKSLILNTPAGFSRPTPERLRSAYIRLATEAAAAGLDKPVWVSALTAATVGFNSPTSLIELFHAARSVSPTSTPPGPTDSTAGSASSPTSAPPCPPAPVSRSRVRDVETAAQIREAGLKCISFVGIPPVINHLTALDAALPREIRDVLNPPSWDRTPAPPRGDNKLPRRRTIPGSAYPVHPFARRILCPGVMPRPGTGSGTSPGPESRSGASGVGTTLASGTSLWQSIYSPLDGKLVTKLSAAHPDLGAYILQCHYGGLLSVPQTPSSGPANPRPGPQPTGPDPSRPSISNTNPHPHENATTKADTDVGALVARAHDSIGRVATSVAAIACLRTIPGAGPQLVSHVHGLRKGIAAGDRTRQRDRDGHGHVDEYGHGHGIARATPESGLGRGQEGRTGCVPPTPSRALEWLATDEGVEWLIGLVDRLGRELGVGIGAGAAGDGGGDGEAACVNADRGSGGLKARL